MAKQSIYSEREINPKIAVEWKDYHSNIPASVLDKLSPNSIDNPVRNTDWTFLFFKDVSVFQPAANAFKRSKKAVKGTSQSPSYTPALEGTLQYKQFWREERKRCIEGYEPKVDGKPCGVRIPGEFYFYLNYCQIEKRVEDPETGMVSKQLDFPDFLSMDYYWFLELEKLENPPQYGLPPQSKKPILMTKARRKGWSFKNAAGAVHKYTFFKKSRTVIVSQFGDKSKLTFDMAMDIVDFLNEHTEFRQPWLARRSSDKSGCFIKAGWIETVDGKKLQKGKKSTIETISINDKPDRTAGLSCTRLLFEEAGQMNELKKAYRFAEPTLRDGEYWTGLPIIYGTGGDMEGSTIDFSEMFWDPESYGLSSYHNIYEKTDVDGKCSWFVDDMWYRPGHIVVDDKVYESVDENGNAYRWVAELLVDQERESAKKTKKEDYTVLLSQKCKTPSEAFLVSEGAVFPVAELQATSVKLKSHDRYKYMGMPVTLSESPDAPYGVDYHPDINNKLNPIFNYPIKSNQDTTGAVVIYEHPIFEGNEIPKGLYIIGVDPYRIDSEGAKSLGCAIVMKTPLHPKYGHDEIVAMYFARPESIKTFNYNVEKLGMFYNAQIMYENDVPDFRTYFEKRRKLHMLAPEPGSVIKKAVPNSRLDRVYGCSMSSDKMKDAGERYIYEWLTQPRGEGLSNMHLIPDLGLIEELIRYRRKGNFDRVMAMMQCVIAIEDQFNEFADPDAKRSLNIEFLTRNKNLFNGVSQLSKTKTQFLSEN